MQQVESYLGIVTRDESTALRVQRGLQSFANRNTTAKPHSSWELSELLLGEGAVKDLARKSFCQPCENLGEMNTQVLVCAISNWKKRKLKKAPTLKTCLVPNVN